MVPRLKFESTGRQTTGGKKLNLIAALLLASASLIILTWLVLPQIKTEKTFAIPRVEFNPEIVHGEERLILPENSLAVRLTWTERIHQGEQAIVEAVVFSEENFNLSVTNFQSTHNLVAEARLDLPPARVLPGDDVRQALNPQGSTRFLWEITPARPDNLEGKFWFYLGLVSKADGEVFHQAVIAAPVVISSVSLLGLSEPSLVLVFAGLLLLSVLLFWFPRLSKNKKNNR